jgi:GH35 family endo-1,4-beta-xylanase
MGGDTGNVIEYNLFERCDGESEVNIKHVDRVSFWGFSGGRSWLNNWPWRRVNHGLLFDRDSKPKPAFHAVSEMLKKGE